MVFGFRNVSWKYYVLKFNITFVITELNLILICHEMLKDILRDSIDRS